MKIALTGNPNSGKTTMFNALTGSSEKVGNWAGVTVDTKHRKIKKSYCPDEIEIVAVDLPGAYSMSPFTSEESITRDYIKNGNFDVIVNIVDATNLSRSLFFTTQILELGIPTVVALNKTDVNNKKKTRIDSAALSEKLGVPVVKTISTSSEGLKEVIALAVTQMGKEQTPPYTQKKDDVFDKITASAQDRKRFEFVNGIVKQVETRKVLTREKNTGDKIDAIITDRWFGIPIFAFVMYLVFQISQVWVGQPVADVLVGGLEKVQNVIGALVSEANPLLSALLVDGVIGGVIAVIGFLPLVMVMYFLIAMLEDCGYMSRAAVVLDPIFKKVGLSGKSVIPFVMSVGCAVPGVMASRTIKNERERRAAVMLAPFMPCGAKIPVISLFAGAFFDNAGWVSTLMYLSGIIIIFFGAILVNKITAYKTRKSFFIIELPDYKLPNLSEAVKTMFSRGWSYIVKAGTIILLCNTAVQIMQTFDIRFTIAESADTSILALIARPFAYALVPIIGYHAWQLAAATVTGFIAKENVVATIAVCYALTDVANELGFATPELTPVAALAFLMFNLYSPPCFAAIGAMNAEMKSAKWLWGGIGLQLAVGYTVSYFVYTIATLVTDASKLDAGAAVLGLMAVIAIVVYIVWLCAKAERKYHAELQTKNSAQVAGRV